VRIVGPKIVVEGEALTPTDYGRVLAVIQEKPYSDYVLNMTYLSPIALTVIAKKIQDDINTFAPNVRTRVVNGVIFLEGTVDDLNQAQRAARIAAVYLPPEAPQSLLAQKDPNAQRPSAGRTLIQNFLVVNPPPPKKAEKLVRVTVHFVELSKDYDKYLGFKWQPGFTAEPSISIGTSQTGTVAANGASFSGTLSNLLPKLGSAQTAGYARILRTGSLIVRSGQAAKLEELQQYPFLIPSGNGTPASGNTQVGVRVAVTPLILGQSEDIQLDLKMGQINVVGRDPATGTQPVTATQDVETRLYVKSNESAAVAGFNSSQIGTDFNKDDPSAGSFSQGTDPVFTLLRSKGYRKRKSQFVIFVTPQIVESASEGTEDLKKNFRVKVK
jgi:pilus assembly protein CpaC